MSSLINIALRPMSEDKEDLCYKCGGEAGLSYYPDYEKNICAHCAKRCENLVGIHGDGSETECGKDVEVWWKGRGYCVKHIPQAYRDFKQAQELAALRAALKEAQTESDGLRKERNSFKRGMFRNANARIRELGLISALQEAEAERDKWERQSDIELKCGLATYAKLKEAQTLAAAKQVVEREGFVVIDPNEPPTEAMLDAYDGATHGCTMLASGYRAMLSAAEGGG